jgi:hypothetical protein
MPRKAQFDEGGAVEKRRDAARGVSRWLVLATVLLVGCGSSGPATLRPAPTAEARATSLGATATAVAASGPPATPAFLPANPPSAVAAVAQTPVLPASATKTGVPLEGTPASIPAADGSLVPVGERRLWIACRGEGSPTVVMDAGVNSGSRVWFLVWPATAATTRVCVYDRAGLGRSDPIPRPRTSQEIVDDLHGLLKNANIPGPYLLVAHSFGGLNVRLYTSQHPTEVDAVHEDRFAATAKVLTPEQQAAFEKGRQANPEGLDYYESSRLVRAIGPSLPNLPTVVIARGRADPWPRGYPEAALERVWRELQQDLASRSPQGTLLIADKSDHNIPGMQPEIVIDATRRVVAAVRGG